MASLLAIVQMPLIDHGSPGIFDGTEGGFRRLEIQTTSRVLVVYLPNRLYLNNSVKEKRKKEKGIVL
jgi:hypothetical protein